MPRKTNLKREAAKKRKRGTKLRKFLAQLEAREAATIARRARFQRDRRARLKPTIEEE